MREIKFRAWDKSQTYMAYQGTPDLETIQSFIFHFGDDILMQSTGLKDKNGKEIYEGDLLKICENTSGCLLVEFKNAYVGGWVLTHPTVYTWMSLGARTPDSIEVYGNIYENPELLS